MLGNPSYMGFIGVREIDAARAFYESVLGLTVIDENPFALVLDANGTMLRVTPVPDFMPQTFTVAGWATEDIAVTAGDLLERGVVCRQFEGMEQDAVGIWHSPSGDLVAWFADPDGNTLSLTQFRTDGSSPA
jgi:catechol 2,3-dioxygenase-like lactoylglutathione lyase family enzyme